MKRQAVRCSRRNGDPVKPAWEHEFLAVKPAWAQTLAEFLGTPRKSKPDQRTQVRPRLWKATAALRSEPFMGGDYGIRRDESERPYQYVVMDGDLPIASYDGYQLIVDPHYRRRGIATELVADFRSRHPEAPPATSRTPLATRTQKAAHRLIVKRAVLARLPVPREVLKKYPAFAELAADLREAELRSGRR